jgi:hypothetical protein
VTSRLAQADAMKSALADAARSIRGVLAKGLAAREPRHGHPKTARAMDPSKENRMSLANAHAPDETPEERAAPLLAKFRRAQADRAEQDKIIAAMRRLLTRAGATKDDDRRRRRSRTLPRGEQRIGRISGGIWIFPRALDARGATPAGSREGRERHGDGEDRRAEGAGRRRELRGEDAARESRGGARGHLKWASPRADFDFDGICPAVAVPARESAP